MLRPATRLLCGHFMRVSLACLLLLLTLLARAAASSNSVFAVGSLGAEDPHACGAGEVGLVDGATAKWIAGSCIAASDWAGDAETATAIEAGVVVVYVNPGLGADTHLYTVDFSARNVSKVLVGGDQGELRCASVAGRPSCFGVSPGDDDDVTQLIEVDAVTGDSSPVLNLTSYEGFSVGGSVVDPINMRYHFIAVGEPHLRAIPTAPVSVPPRPRPTAMRRRCRRAARCSPPPSDRSAAAAEPSDQWLVTIDLKRMTIIAEAPLSRNFMGPLSVSEAHVRLFVRPRLRTFVCRLSIRRVTPGAGSGHVQC